MSTGETTRDLLIFAALRVSSCSRTAVVSIDRTSLYSPHVAVMAPCGGVRIQLAVRLTWHRRIETHLAGTRTRSSCCGGMIGFEGYGTAIVLMGRCPSTSRTYCKTWLVPVRGSCLEV